MKIRPTIGWTLIALGAGWFFGALAWMAYLALRDGGYLAAGQDFNKGVFFIIVFPVSSPGLVTALIGRYVRGTGP